MTNEEAIRWLNVERELIVEIPQDNSKELKEAYDMAIKALEVEYLTDKEQRIFLRAMSRERAVCKDVDDTYEGYDSKISLVNICNEIERKVKKIWER